MNARGLLHPRADRMRVMGVLNVTPDSFSDGGRYESLEAAVRHGLALHAAGADLVDVGGESTRPGARALESGAELARVLPVVRELAAAGVPLSIDTMHAAVAAAALDAGASVVNDVSGGLGDPGMAAVVRDAGCPWILMHWRGPSDRMQQLAVYGDVVADVRAELAARADAAVAAGVDATGLVLDPGIGFAKTAEHNWQLLAGLDAIVGLGLPVLVGTSRKAFLGRVLAAADGTPRPVDRREAATVTLTGHAELTGAWGVRVHDVEANIDAALTARALSASAHRARSAGAGPDRVRLVGLTVRGHHGVFEHERVDGQDFVVDAELELDIGPAAASDDLARTVDYGALAHGLADVIGGEPVDLIETLAERLAAVCLRDARVRAATVTVHKPGAPIPLSFADVTVTVRRTRR